MKPARPFPTEVLEAGLTEHFERPIEIVDVKAQPLPTSSHVISRLTVTLASGERLPVIFKSPRPGEPLYGNEREVLIYRSVLRGGRFGAPTLYASVYDATNGRYELFLEDLGDATLNDSGSRTWEAAAQWLAELHAAYLGREEELRSLGCLMEHDATYYRMVAHAARRKLELANVDAAVLARFDELTRPLESLIAYLVRQPRTFVHGDIFDANLMVQPGRRIRAVDWESAAIGLGAWDLSRLLDGWGPERELLRSAYLEKLEARLALSFDRRAFDRTFAHCRVLDILWHLRWSVDACRDAAFVEAELTRLETRWAKLDRSERNTGEDLDG
jgi:aminoglycoside phosphotransferase (APT) family kinase protein